MYIAVYSQASHIHVAALYGIQTLGHQVSRLIQCSQLDVYTCSAYTIFNYSIYMYIPQSHTLTDIVPTANEQEAFSDIDVAFLVGSMPRKEGMLRKELLIANAKIFRSQGKSLDQYAKKTVKVSELLLPYCPLDSS